ncbi:uncharacterized protein LOC133923050 [Phragmites australis]|uniref:uncharacterized protein LOC133923050 n=1 Tax=Phragmites australis TaxID=29695 RepID=UPI002D776EEB|nr:uncharacterized protein LOC133923050 [Phragmites australis]
MDTDLKKFIRGHHQSHEKIPEQTTKVVVIRLLGHGKFVRFVSTPEVLEWMTTIESKKLQIEDAIAVQGNDNLGLRYVEYHNGKSLDCLEGLHSYSHYNLLQKMLRYESAKRISAKKALEHPDFSDVNKELYEAIQLVGNPSMESLHDLNMNA